MLSEGTAGFVL